MTASGRAVLPALVLFYVLTGKLGLHFASLHASATPLWPPTGIALAALLLGGYRLWPAIFLGAFIVNVTTAGSVLTSVGIATGNTLEALIATWLVRRFAHGVEAFRGPSAIFVFTLGAGFLATAVTPAGLRLLGSGTPRPIARIEDAQLAAVWSWEGASVASDPFGSRRQR